MVPAVPTWSGDEMCGTETSGWIESLTEHQKDHLSGRIRVLTANCWRFGGGLITVRTCCKKVFLLLCNIKQVLQWLWEGGVRPRAHFRVVFENQILQHVELLKNLPQVFQTSKPTNPALEKATASSLWPWAISPARCQGPAPPTCPPPPAAGGGSWHRLP